MMQQQDAVVKPPDGVNNNASTAHMVSSSKLGRQKGGGSSNHTPDQVQKCPRCDSLNTKFCYYNNYSLSQPRHFCKNCRRYWTKGGALRNVPIGGGCRKNKRVKQRSPLDPSSLASLAEVESGAASNLLPSINGCPPLQLPASFSTPGPSASSLITELANESHRYGLTFSRLQEPMRLADQSGAAMPSTQGLFTLGGHPAPLMGTLAPFDPTFPSLSYPKPDPQAIMYHHHHGSELTPFYEHISSTASMPPTLDHLSSFSSPSAHHVNTSSNNNSSMDAQLSLIHQNHLPLHMVNNSGGHFNEDQHTAGGGFEEESAGISMRRSKGKVILSSLSDWQLGPASENLFSSSSANDQGNLWNVSWPEMHAALAGSTTAGAMLH